MEPTWTDYALTKLREARSPYLPFAHDGLEWQFKPVEGDDDALDRWANEWPLRANPHDWRIPRNGDGKNDGPTDNNGPLDYHPALIACFGTSWWDWKRRLTEGCAIDFDYGHGGHALDDAGIALVDSWAKQLPYVQNATSKGSRGRHWLVRLKNPLPANVRAEHSRNCKAIIQRVSADLGVNLPDYYCSAGGIQYLWARNVAGGDA